MLSSWGAEGCFLFCFYIKPQLNALMSKKKKCCFLFCFYIKPQPSVSIGILLEVVSYFVSTSNHNWDEIHFGANEVVSYFVSTSNHNLIEELNSAVYVVSYFVSTSNHNIASLHIIWPCVVSYFVSTSNHNYTFLLVSPLLLFLILFLHQTTTLRQKSSF